MSTALSGVPRLPEAVSVRYAREQYALGYLHGRREFALQHADSVDPRDFARFYVARCERSGRLVDVADAYRTWLTTLQSPAGQLVLFSE